jgi:leucyl aminopeptidase (aminopeptidase T)
VSADFGALKARCTQLAALLGRAASARFSCRNGSDMMFDLTEREGRAEYGVLTARHAFGNLPAGEGFISPRTGEGVVAAVSGPPGLMDEPMQLTIEAGRLVDAGGPHGSGVLEMLLEHGPLGPNLAELGVGANDAARVTGNVLEDEKSLGTVHVAFGASAGIGGTVSVPVHRDFVVVEPTLDIGRTRVLDAGRWVL